MNVTYKFTDSVQQRCFWISDNHFSHKKIIEYCNRPFSTAEEMDEEMIKRWNAKVTKADIVFFLGDFCFGRDSIDPSLFLSRLNGKIYWVVGNHEKLDRIAVASNGKIMGFHQILNISVNHQNIVMCHYPITYWEGREGGAWMLFGHCHNSYQAPDHTLSWNCGVELNNYEPISFGELQKIMEPRKIKFNEFKQQREANKGGEAAKETINVV